MWYSVLFADGPAAPWASGIISFDSQESGVSVGVSVSVRVGGADAQEICRISPIDGSARSSELEEGTRSAARGDTTKFGIDGDGSRRSGNVVVAPRVREAQIVLDRGWCTRRGRRDRRLEPNGA